MARKPTAAKGSRSTTRSGPRWEQIGYERMSEWLGEYGPNDKRTKFRRVVADAAFQRAQVTVAPTYAGEKSIKRYFSNKGRVNFVCALLRFAKSEGKQRQKLLADLMTGKVPLPKGGSIEMEHKGGWPAARLVQQNILTKVLRDALEHGKDIDDPWVLARVVKGESDQR